MTANQLIPILEGIVGSGLRGAPNSSGRQATVTWLECLKVIMRSTGLRDATDWNIAADADIIETSAGGLLDTGSGIIYGMLVDSIFDVSGEHLIVHCSDVATGVTFTAETGVDFGADEFGPDDGLALVKIAPAADTSTPQFGTWLDPQGQILSNDVSCMANGEEGTSVTTNDVRVWIVYRDTVTVRVS